MQLITLTTDYGSQDQYVAICKAAILEACPNAYLLDISHQITPFNLPHAELVVRQSYNRFSAGTVHVIAVREHYTEHQEWLILKHAGYQFIAPNNGFLPMLLPEVKGLTKKIIFTEHCANAIGHCVRVALLDEETQNQYLSEEVDVQMGLRLRPVITRERMRGTVIYADHYGNVVTNIEKGEFEHWIGNQPYKVLLKRNEPLQEISYSYASVPSGEPVAIWNDGNFLTIAVCHANAQTLLSLEPNDVIDIVKSGS